MTELCISCEKRHDSLNWTSRILGGKVVYICRDPRVQISGDTRSADLQELASDLKTAPAHERKNIQEAINTIRNESSKIRDMRRALLKEKRLGKLDNIKDIHEFIQGREEYGRR